MNIVSITQINVYTVCTKKHKWVTVRFVFLKALWLLYGDKIGREQVWKWEIIGRVQTSQDVGGDCGDGGKERSRKQEETVSPPPRLEHGASAPGSMDCPWPSAEPGPGVETTVPGGDSPSPRGTSVCRLAPPTPAPART